MPLPAVAVDVDVAAATQVKPGDAVLLIGDHDGVGPAGTRPVMATTVKRVHSCPGSGDSQGRRAAPPRAARCAAAH
jgi:hypothetical protein